MKQSLAERKLLNAMAVVFSYFRLIPYLFRLNSKSIVMDCGANVGHLTTLFAVTGARVFAFEPDPVAYHRLSRRFEGHKNVVCTQKGVWHKNAIVQLYEHECGAGISFTVGSSIIAEKINVSKNNKRDIEVIDIVEFIAAQGANISLIKLDVEGAEIEILKSILATHTYLRFDRMYVETHERKIPGQAQDLKRIKQEILDKGIKNIRLNWI